MIEENNYWDAVKNPHDRRFMLDLEATGVNIETDDILEVGVLEVQWPHKHSMYWVPGRSFNFVLHSKRKPENAFARNTMAGLYKLCNETPETSNISSCREALSKWLDTFDVRRPDDVHIMGNAVSNFDIPFTIKHKLLEPSGYIQDPEDRNKEIMTGDFHYRIHEQQGGVELAMKVIDFKGERRAFVEFAREAYPTPIPKESPAALGGACKPHRALYDCYKQVDLENGLIHLLRKWK